MLDLGVDGQGSVFLGYEGMEVVVIYFKIFNFYVLSEIMGECGSIIIDKIGFFEYVEI